jgi:NADPH2:quinone reductase
MTPEFPQSSLELRSLVTEQGTLELSLTEVDLPALAPSQVLLRVEAAPINPSDLGLLLAGADMSSASADGTPDRPVVTAPLPEGSIRALTARVGTSLPVGNEGAGTVMAAGTSPEAQALLEQTVSVAAGGMYTQYRICEASLCLVLPEATPARVGASAFVNPLTTLGMIETMRREGHTALVHTAAASNLGQMLVKLCQEEDVPLVNIVRKPKQERILRSIGAVHVCDSSAPSFRSDLTKAVGVTSATLGFDATGGGKLASQILSAM